MSLCPNSGLTDELVRRGHEVTLFASGDSRTEAHLEAVVPRSIRATDEPSDVWEALNLHAAMRRSDRFDLIHIHSMIPALPIAALSPAPLLTTLHSPIEGRWTAVFERYEGWYSTVSAAAARDLQTPARYAGFVHNAIPVASYPFSPEPGPSLVFLSRMSPEKAPHLAIEAARRAGRTLLLMGELQPQYEGYFHREVEPRLDGRQFRYLGSVPAEVKRRILAGSVGLLAPVQWPEPFGLFLVESLACGTPVIAFDRGAVPEIIEHGRTGFVVNSLDEMVAAVDRLPEIDRRRCRQAAERRFDAPRMAEGYLRLYERILSEGSSSRPRASRPSEPSVVPPQELGHVA